MSSLCSVTLDGGRIDEAHVVESYEFVYHIGDGSLVVQAGEYANPSKRYTAAYAPGTWVSYTVTPNDH